jgi:uncharacterized linocin/CFP29 family protein
MDLLKRSLAPVQPEAFAAVDAEAARVLKLNLAGRKLVDFSGPHGWQLAAVNTGRLQLLPPATDPDLHLGIRGVQPLVEVRVPIRLPTMELDSVARGATNPDLAAVVRAAEKVAHAEDADRYAQVLAAAEDGYPLAKRLTQQVLDGPLVRAAAIQGGVLLSLRGGDWELTVRQDLSIGYAHHDRETVELYLTESFTFRVLEPAAAVFLRG